MFLRVDGHEIPLFTDADVPGDAESHKEFGKHLTTPCADDGAISAVLPGSFDKAIPYTFWQGSDTNVLMDCTVVHPPGGDDMNIASMRPVRLKNRPNGQTDALHQVQLFHAVGSVTVAGGHVEMAMKRVLVTLRGGKNSDLAAADVPAEWSTLEDRLLKSSKAQQTDLQRAVYDIVSKPEVAGLRDGRNDVVHGYWWLIPIGTAQLVSSRYYRPKANQPQDPAQMHPTLEMLQRLASDLFELAHALESLVTPYWPLAIIPGMERFGRGDFELESRADKQRTSSARLRLPEADKPKPGQRPAGTDRRSKRKRRGGGR
ncbi:hypothetical protein [Mycobacteroides salmoniphilum]|uniref:hypothetical protein n=1 Tax=Mycobacteroides salmoniphilum TaxID=404941 RepID=UPI001064DB60|nr:hypothetical protein [Mycobacteroides salmoniphilum]TDZ90705.1 hypothetical protein CCUG62472_03958 [Mycobacteroides salmoniphilum]